MFRSKDSSAKRTFELLFLLVLFLSWSTIIGVGASSFRSPSRLIRCLGRSGSRCVDVELELKVFVGFVISFFDVSDDSEDSFLALNIFLFRFKVFLRDSIDIS